MVLEPCSPQIVRALGFVSLAAWVRVFVLVGSLLASVTSPLEATSPVDATAPFAIETLAPGVHLFRASGPGTDHANSLIIERGDGTLVVDAQPTPSAARDLLEAIAARGLRPVRFLILSHPHAEAGGGASAFPDSVMIFASDAARLALRDPAYDFGAEIRANAVDPVKWTEPPRPAPTVVLFGPTELDDPVNPVLLSPLPEAHSRGDILVTLKQHSLMHVGGLLATDRNPWAGDADVGGWLTALNGILKQNPAMIVGVRGAMVDTSAIRRQRDGLAWIRGQVEATFIDRLPREAVVPHVLAAEGLERHFDVTAQPSFVGALIERSLEESLAQRRKRGAS